MDLSADGERIRLNPSHTDGSLDKSSSIPLYRQLEVILRGELADGYQAAQGLTELGLAQRFGVSRYTVRQALQRLQAAGLVQRQKKRGTFPAPRSVIQQPLEGIYSFGRSAAGLGLAPESKVLALRSVRSANGLVAQFEVVSAEESLVELVRLRSAGGEPLVLETIWLPEALVPGIQHVDLTGSVYDVLRDLYRIEMTSAQESIRPVVIDTRRARLLGVSRGAPAFFVQRVSYVGDRPIEVRHSLIRGDRYLYSVRLHGTQARPEDG